MNQMPPYPLVASPFLAWTDLFLLSTQMLMSSAQALGFRSSRMLLAGDIPDARDEQNFDSLGEDKAAAAVAATQSIAQSLFKLSEQLAILAGRQMSAGLPLMISFGWRGLPQHPASAGTTPASMEGGTIQNKMEPVTSRTASVASASALRKTETRMHPTASANRKRLSKHAANRSHRKSGAHHPR